LHFLALTFHRSAKTETPEDTYLHDNALGVDGVFVRPVVTNVHAFPRYRSIVMKRIIDQLATFAGLLVATVFVNPAHAQNQDPANPPVYACVDTPLLGGAQSVHWQTSLPCVAPLLDDSSQPGQPSQTVFTAAFNADGTLAASSALSGDAAFNAGNGVYTITFKSAFAAQPACQAVLVGAGSTDFQIEISNVTTTGATVAIQSVLDGYDAAASSFVMSCSNPQ
jgi:hypothetical protein